MGPLPNLLIVGTAKSGTNSIKSYLEQHPQAGFSCLGEPNFFAWDSEYRKGLDHYRCLFAGHEDKLVRAEKSWRYSVREVYPLALERILEALPSFRVLYVVRNPISRAVSLWTEFRDSGTEFVQRDFETAVFHDRVIFDSFRYHSHYVRFRDRLPPGRAKLMFFEDLVSNQADFFSELCRFLAIDEHGPTDAIHANRSEGQTEDYRATEWARRAGLVDVARRSMPARGRARLRRLLRKPIRKPRFSPGARDRFVELLGTEFELILREGGKPSDYWDLGILR
ncbi:MAG TPA: sulfotransferase domain-containing protein [Thermohalobaculum sp.]|nr:sulfotransferase domain-containing protein [Thermohalobaculum sp.]